MISWLRCTSRDGPSEALRKPQVDAEVGAVVVLDDVLDETELQRPSLPQLPLPAQCDFVGRVRERTVPIDQRFGETYSAAREPVTPTSFGLVAPRV